MKEESDIRNYLKIHRGWKPHSLRNHEDSGIRGLLRSRFTKIKREIYPWDEDSVTWRNNPLEAAQEMSEALVEVIPNCHLTVQMENTGVDAPFLMLTARNRIAKDRLILTETSVLHAVLPIEPATYCDTCGASLEVSTALLQKATVDANDVMKSYFKKSQARSLRKANRNSAARSVDKEKWPKPESNIDKDEKEEGQVAETHEKKKVNEEQRGDVEGLAMDLDLPAQSKV